MAQTPENRQIIEKISGEKFLSWYREQQFAQNILEGKEYFNHPSPPKLPSQHSPSKLFQCKRKASYSRQNAPREGDVPTGLFWIGTEFEEDVLVPFLQDATDENMYVTNSVWIDVDISVAGTDLRIRGSTDPVIVTAEADPLVLTEVKTTKSLDHLSGPKPHHKAQLHAYLCALDNQHDYPIQDGAIIYGSRKTLDIDVYHVPFDPEFWNDVTEWMASLTEYEQTGELPPGSPERDWECEYCSFRNRCGKADSPFQDVEYNGLLPLFTEYGRENLVEYLDAHADQDAKLTPTLAHEYPDLAVEYGAYKWQCPACESSYEWDAVEWDGDVTSPPVCEACLARDQFVTMAGPDPERQHE